MAIDELPSKDQLKNELALLLHSELETAERVHRATLEAATHEEAKPENDKDTRALEQSYLARGQAMRVQELRSAVAQVRGLAVRPFRNDDPIVTGALVTISLDGGGESAVLFVAPCGGGSRLAEGLVLVVTLESPLGRAILGRCAGDSCEVVLRDKTRELAVLTVS